MMAHSPAAEPSSSPAKRQKRVDWEWKCPACSNRLRTGPRLLQHMQKCCGDLLPSPYSMAVIDSLLVAEQQHQQQRTQSMANTNQPDESDMQAVVTAACQQEHTLRMRALHLRFIDADSKQPSVAAPAAAAAAEAGGGAEEDEEPPDTTPSAPQLPAEPACVSPSSTIQPAVTKKRGRQRSSGRTPVRTIEQVMQELQLPKTRCGRPSAAAHTALGALSIAELSRQMAPATSSA